MRLIINYQYRLSINCYIKYIYTKRCTHFPLTRFLWVGEFQQYEISTISRLPADMNIPLFSEDRYCNFSIFDTVFTEIIYVVANNG